MNLYKKFVASQTLVFVAVVGLAGAVGFGVSYLVANKKSSSSVRVPTCTETCVNLLADKASPDTLAVTTGTYVTFNSADGKSHRLTLGGGTTSHGSEHSDPGSFDSGEFKSDESWRVQFKEEGTYNFKDAMNPKTDIIVVVYTEGKEYKVN